MTFVRSCDLDEWTQPQIDAMKLGGNGNARAYFRKHGFTDLYGGKTMKKYKCKAAVSYRAELEKLVRMEHGVGGEADNGGVNSGAGGKNGDLLKNLEAKDANDAAAAAAAAKERANATTSVGVLTPSAKLASAMPGASKLMIKTPGSSTTFGSTTKSSSGLNVGMLRKPASKSGTNFMKKKPAASAGKLRVNKLAMKLPTTSNGDGGADDDDEGFDDVEKVLKDKAEAEEKAKQMENDEAIARTLQNDLDLNGGTSYTIAPTPAAPVATQPVAPKGTTTVPPSIEKASSKDENLAKLKSMTSDFFSSM